MSVSTKQVESTPQQSRPHWPSVQLADCCKIISGGTPKSSEASYWDGAILWATPKDLTDLDTKYISSTPRAITESGYTKSSANMLPAESVLFSSRAPIGHVAINTVPMCTNQGFKSLVPDTNQIVAEYLYYWLRANKTQLQALGNGATFKEISKAAISKVEIPLPPLPEQRRIAAILDKADALRQKRREAIAKLDQLLQSVFLEMFGDPVTNPKGWAQQKADHVFDGFVGGKNVQCPSEDEGSACRILKVSAVTSNTFQGSESKPAPRDYVPTESAMVRPGDLLFSRANTVELVAATAFVWRCDENLVLPDKIWRLVPAPDADVELLFLWEMFKNEAFRRELCKRATGTSGSMKNISKAKLREAQLCIPPMALQKKFADISRRFYRLVDFQRSSVQGLEAIFSALQQRAFTGQL